MASVEFGKDTANANWLRSLTPTSAKRLYELMCSNTGGISSKVAEGTELPFDFDHYLVLDDSVSPLKTGKDWRRFITCMAIERGAGGMVVEGGYARFQLQWHKGKDGSWETPTKRYRNQMPLLKRVKDVLEDQEWEAFKVITKPEDESTSKISRKIMAHHIAYNYLAKSNPELYAPLPESTGAGSSISHLCDNKCITPAHMVAAHAHVDNMVRQRCAGVLLLCKRGVILQVVNCPHFQMNEAGIIVSPNCLKIRVEELAFEPFDAEKRQSFLNKVGEFEVASLNQDEIDALGGPAISGGGVLPFGHV